MENANVNAGRILGCCLQSIENDLSIPSITTHSLQIKGTQRSTYRWKNAQTVTPACIQAMQSLNLALILFFPTQSPKN